MDQAWICVAFFWVFAILCLFWMYRQHVLFSNQLDKIGKEVEDGIDTLGDSLKKARERIAQLEEDYCYEKELAKQLACDLMARIKEVESLRKENKRLDRCIDAFATEAARVGIDLERRIIHEGLATAKDQTC